MLFAFTWEDLKAMKREVEATVFSLFVILYKKIRKIIKKLLTTLDNDDIIINCIIIAYYAQIAEKQVFVSINSIYIRAS